jgi:RecA/RadA recombinase
MTEPVRKMADLISEQVKAASSSNTTLIANDQIRIGEP